MHTWNTFDCIVNRIGLVIQNSWGKRWGAAGFAVISYNDWLAHAMDAWVGRHECALSRLRSTCIRLSNRDSCCTGSIELQLVGREDTAYRHSTIQGNNGRVDRFDTLDDITRTLQNQACEKAAIQRAQAMGRYFLGNGCYPLFLV